MAGYSGTPLAKKLGLESGRRALLVNAPAGPAASVAGAEVEWRKQLRGPLDVVVFFTTRRSELERRLPQLIAALDPAAGLWVCWPKRSSGVETDIDEDLLRELILPTGLVDNKVCAVDETWSGLRFVIRKENR